ncbi:TIM44-like domain-containing protein [Ferrovibrio sp.]|uniref:TIM44-like domain-containing protein n=1 Tax=Ferrovibrio sp. TaxID=1917215 RepID=UPI001B51BE78|nr:TIM44-like domain-containing protein [Ferrovibrio sp.]MBP7064722.1 TIM44-like domain-containing protein [Ferrovibrio sp.]
MRKFKLLGIIGLGLMLTVLPALVEAKAGRSGGSMGSRGSRTYDAAPSTPTAPSAAPVQRSVTPPPAAGSTSQAAAPRAGQPAAAAPAAAGRSPFMSGLMGGLLGAGLIGLLFGSGLFGAGGMGAAGMFGLLLQVLLIGGLAWLAISFFRRRSAAQAGMQPGRPAMAGGAPVPASYEPAPLAREASDNPRYDIPGAGSPAGNAAMADNSDGVGIGEADYQAFEQRLKDVQAAWSKADVVALTEYCTPEMASFLSRDLAELASLGQSNQIEDVVLEQGDLAEAWREDGVDYATVAMRWSALDYTINRADGSVVEGSREQRSESVEVWTFLRAGSTGKWLLSAIQQPSGTAL